MKKYSIQIISEPLELIEISTEVKELQELGFKNITSTSSCADLWTTTPKKIIRASKKVNRKTMRIIAEKILTEKSERIIHTPQGDIKK